MAEQPSRRASAAAKRSGILSRLGESKIGRKIIAPAATVMGLASQLKADQARERQATSDTPQNSKAATPRPRVDADGLRGAKPRAPLGAGLASQLAADQARDRIASQTEGDTGGLADLHASGEEPTLLEVPVRSYTRHGETNEEKELVRQHAMTRRMEQFLTPDGGPIGGEEVSGTTGTPTSARGQREAETEAPGTARGTVRETMEEDEAWRAAALADARMREARAAQERARTSAEAAMAQRRAFVTANKRLRAGVKAVQAAAAETILPIFTLVLQMNLETFNKWVTKIRVPFILEVEKDPTLDMNDMATGCIDCACCTGCFIFMGLFAFIFALIYVGSSDIGSGLEFIWEAFRGLFG